MRPKEVAGRVVKSVEGKGEAKLERGSQSSSSSDVEELEEESSGQGGWMV